MSNQPPRGRLTQADTLERRQKLLDLVRDGRYTWEHIADQLGYASRGAACADYGRIVEARRKELAQTLDQQRAAQLEGLQEIRRVAVEVMRRDHPLVQGGRIVRVSGDDDNPEYLNDAGPTLAAIDRIAKIDAQIAALLGLNAPTRVEADGKLQIRIEGVSDTELENLT